MQLDLIDLDAPLSDQAAVMSRACSTTGFFLLPLSVIDREVADQAWDLAREFFALPTDEKQRVGFPEPGYPYGYSPMRFETLARSLDPDTDSGPDLKESFSAGPDCGQIVLADNDDESWIRSPSLWPQSPTGLRAAWEAYYRALGLVADKLMSVMAVALDLAPDYFESMIDRPITSMRAINYPEVDPAVGSSDSGGSIRGKSIRAGAHSDYGTLTILRTDDVEGLEIRADDDTWIPVTPRPDSFVVNLGDSIAQWTNNRWQSTVHRVMVGDGAPRQSFAYFHMANWNATIECLPTCLAPDEDPDYAPVQAGPWLMRKFHSTVK